MGDRTSVTLTILASQYDEAIKIPGFEGSASEEWEDGLLMYFNYKEVNSGQLPFLPQLKQAGIAFDSAWEQGNEYGPGTNSLRFDLFGDPIEKEIYDSERGLSLDSLMPLINDPEKLKAFILSHHEEMSVLPWDNQEEFARRYKTKQLISDITHASCVLRYGAIGLPFYFENGYGTTTPRNRAKQGQDSTDVAA